MCHFLILNLHIYSQFSYSLPSKLLTDKKLNEKQQKYIHLLILISTVIKDETKRIQLQIFPDVTSSLVGPCEKMESNPKL